MGIGIVAAPRNSEQSTGVAGASAPTCRTKRTNTYVIERLGRGIDPIRVAFKSKAECGWKSIQIATNQQSAALNLPSTNPENIADGDNVNLVKVLDI